MNRLSPLISRRARSIVVPVASVSMTLAETYEPGRWLDDLRLFATAWAGGVVFFATLLS